MMEISYASNFLKPFFDSLKNYQPNLHSLLPATQPPPPLLSQSPIANHCQSWSQFFNLIFSFLIIYVLGRWENMRSNRKYTFPYITKTAAKGLKISSFSKIIFCWTKHSLWLYNIYDRKLRNFEIIWFNLLYS